MRYVKYLIFYYMFVGILWDTNQYYVYSKLICHSFKKAVTSNQAKTQDLHGYHIRPGVSLVLSLILRSLKVVNVG